MKENEVLLIAVIAALATITAAIITAVWGNSSIDNTIINYYPTTPPIENTQYPKTEFWIILAMAICIQIIVWIGIILKRRSKRKE